MEQVQKKMKLWKKIVIGIVAALVGIILVLGITVYAIWHNEISTIASMQLIRERNDAHLDGAVYTMHVKGGFYLDEFVAQGGAKSDSELIDFVTAKITKGLISMGISDPEIGCSSFTATSESGDVLYEELNKTGGVAEDEQAAMEILRIVGRRTWDNDDGNGCTVHSVVYNLTDKTMMWIPNENYDDPDAVFTFQLDNPGK